MASRDLDQIYADLRSTKHVTQFKSLRPTEDLPGLGQWYCLHCARYFESEQNLAQHGKSKNHKRRVRSLEDEPYSQKEADAAIGLGTDNGNRKPSALTQIEDQAASMKLDPL
ncbi:MAG: hypothetical protein LQ342_001394 [Letrouitia transgressa]|nr:MAG: hypothetical protein LQ342_001394 [Letrouitia transgressa]